MVVSSQHHSKTFVNSTEKQNFIAHSFNEVVCVYFPFSHHAQQSHPLSLTRFVEGFFFQIW